MAAFQKTPLNIRNIYDLPAVAPAHDSSICKNGPKLLELAAVQGNTYLWSNGAVTNSIRISDTGRYTVSITDKNGCKNKDQFIINTILPLPANFFAYADTAICTYGTLILATPLKFQQLPVEYQCQHGNSDHLQTRHLLAAGNR